ncbi:6-phosphogluconate dehydrogenase C-terminal domain-like protein [Rickenella mellea]|uniref:6-phosphogluconate dehydrogenase C-terminal domain-like protein n=1 Tax=Rickenella mellea TaxID=50990 RepID=A0A4Y7Q5R3_9AGAM|nr:6-phosphogluconate dehydrogenase C-terminal domain-like protein [Rickenella mellea]
MAPSLSVISAGSMGSAIAAKMVKAGCTVYTSSDGRSQATKERIREVGMIDVPTSELFHRADWLISILPPSEAFAFAEKAVLWASQLQVDGGSRAERRLYFVDCNAVNPDTAKRIGNLFENSSVTFIDAGIIGGPPSDTYDPTIYASTSPSDIDALDDFTKLNSFGLKIRALTGEDAGIGDASALKMSYAGISKGMTGIFTTMILAAHSASPATSMALLRELHASQPAVLQRITAGVPSMLPKAYRWVGEMEEIAGFVGDNEGRVYEGMAQLYRRIENSVKNDGEGEGDVGVLQSFVRDAKAVLEKGS